MNIHEYQAKAILREFGAPVAAGVPVLKAGEAAAAAKQLGFYNKGLAKVKIEVIQLEKG